MPVLVSVAATWVVAAARDVTLFVFVFVVRDVGVLVAIFFVVAARGVKMETFFAPRAETVVFTAFLDVVDRAVWVFVVVTFVFLPRDTVFPARVADSALHMQTAQIKVKYRIFFISWLILANL